MQVNTDLKKASAVELMDQGEGRRRHIEYGRLGYPNGQARATNVRIVFARLACFKEALRFQNVASLRACSAWRRSFRKKTMPEPYASIIAVLYVVGAALLVVALPSRLRSTHTRHRRKNAVLAQATQAGASSLNHPRPDHADRVKNAC